MKINHSIGSAGLAIMVFFVSAAVLRADSVTLKTGRVIEGDIVDRGEDFVTIHDGESSFKVRYTQMSEESRALLNGESPPVKKTGSTEEVLERLAMELGKEEWKERVEIYRKYFEQVGDLQVQFIVTMLQSAVIINHSLRRKNVPISAKLVQETYQQILYLKEQMEQLTPLEELRPFHEKVANSFALTLKAIDAWSVGDQHIYYSCDKKAGQSMIDAMEEYALFIEILGTSPGEIKIMRAATAHMRSQIEQLYY